MNQVMHCAQQIVLTIIVLVVSLWLGCLSPVDNEDDNAALTLSLEKKGTTKAVFSGQPIVAYLTIRDSVRYTDLVWHGGKAKHRNPYDLVANRPITDFDRFVQAISVELFWTEKPVNRDENDNQFDSLFVSIGGQLRTSNVVRVIVANLAPVLDSIYIDSAGFNHAIDLPADSAIVWEINNLDTIRLRVKASDADDRVMRIAFTGGTKGVLLADAMQESRTAVYLAPKGFFADTIRIKVYDSNGGQVVRTVVIQRRMANFAPKIDSVVVNGTKLQLGNNAYRFVSTAFDTLTIQAFVRDSNGDALSAQWTTRRGVYRDTLASPTRRTYISNDRSVRDTLDGLMVGIDTLSATFADPMGANVRMTIYIAHGSPNEFPTIDTIYVGATAYAKRSQGISVGLAPGQTVALRVLASDLDLRDSVLTYHWKCGDSTRLLRKGTDSSAYTASATPSTDTLIVAVTDTKQGSDTARVYISVSAPPIIDSISVESGGDKTIFLHPQTSFSYQAAISAQVDLAVFARDGIVVTGLNYSWTLRGKGTLTPVVGAPSTSRYLAPAVVASDTVIVSVRAQSGVATADTVLITVK